MDKDKQAKSKSNAASDKGWALMLWLVLGANTVFLIWQCLDRYLAPRFLFLSLVLLSGFVWLRRDLFRRADWRFNTFDLLLLGWYAFNVLAMCWAFSWSEALFYTQRCFLLFISYWFFRQMLHLGETFTREKIRQIVLALTTAVSLLIIGQLMYASAKAGLSNEALYDYASGVFGNKSLAADFLFFLLVLNLLFYNDHKQRWVFPLILIMLVGLILILQVRTVYGALVLIALLWAALQAVFFPQRRKRMFKRILLPGLLFAAGLTFLALRSGGSLAERLNPMTYLNSASFNERRFVWYKTDLLNEDHYWFGVGPGSWKIWFPSKNIAGGYRLQEENTVFTRAHNDYLEVRSETGMVGAVWYLGLFILAFALGIRRLHRSKQDEENIQIRRDVRSLLLGLAGYCLIQYFDFPKERIEMQVILALFFAWITHHSKFFLPPTLSISLSVRPFLFIAPVLLLLALNVWIGWNRVIGEVYTLKVYEAMSKGRFREVKILSEKARNRFYAYNDVVLPLEWYEGIATYRLNDFQGSIPYFERAYALNPWSFQVLNNYGTALASTGRNEEAVRYLEEGLSINPSHDEGKFNLAIIYKRLGDKASALKWIERMDTIPNPANEKAIQRNRDIKARKAEALKMLE